MTDLERLISWLNLCSISSGEEFILASGERSTVYVDVKKTALHGKVHKLLAKLLWDKMVEEFSRKCGVIEAVAGVALGGCHLASIIAMHAPYDLDVIHVRKNSKDHGTQNLLERPKMAEQQHVVLVEDVVTTGGSSIKAAEAIEKEGFRLLGIISVVDRRKTKSSHLGNQWPFVSLVNFEQLTV